MLLNYVCRIFKRMDASMSSFDITLTPLDGVLKVQRQRKGDTRGFLSRIFCSNFMADLGWVTPIAQINHTLTQEIGTVRGMHFQHPPFAEMKLVSCIRGAIWDVAVDLRKGSPTFLHWHAELLSQNNQSALLLPEGVAHGFQVLEPDSELLYCHSAPYNPIAEAGLHPMDPSFAISWPLEVKNLSERDRSQLFINDAFAGVVLT